jgi:hypothetical protein
MNESLKICLYLISQQKGFTDFGWLNHMKHDWYNQVTDRFDCQPSPELDAWAIDPVRRSVIRQEMVLALIELERWDGVLPVTARIQREMDGNEEESCWPITSVREALLQMILLLNVD